MSTKKLKRNGRWVDVLQPGSLEDDRRRAQLRALARARLPLLPGETLEGPPKLPELEGALYHPDHPESAGPVQWCGGAYFLDGRRLTVRSTMPFSDEGQRILAGLTASPPAPGAYFKPMPDELIVVELTHPRTAE